MKRKVKHEEILSRLSDIAFGKANDIVKLAFLNPEEDLEILDELDLTMLSEVKRTTGGAVEVKLVDRLEAMELLLTELGTAQNGKSDAEEFFKAMDRAAKIKESAE